MRVREESEGGETSIHIFFLLADLSQHYPL